jgi:hypothetical protein
MEEVQRIKRQGSESRQACLDGRVAMELDKVNLNDYTQIGEGGNGKTYVTSAAPDEILKVNNARLSTWEAVKHEYDVSKAVASLGIPVPAMYRIVQVGDAYATISQRIKGKKSLSRICHDEPERTEEMARLFLICHIYAPMKRVQDIFHMTLEQFHRFWDAFAKEYTGQDDHAAFDAQAGRFAALDVVLRTVFQKPNFVEKLFFGIYIHKLMKQYYS